jgi:hypothetical protein
MLIIKKKTKPDMVGTPIMPALRRLRREYVKFEACLSYIAKPCLKKKKEFLGVAGCGTGV